MMEKPSLLRVVYNRIQRLPEGARNRAFTLVFSRSVKFVGTAGLRFEHLSPERCVVHIANRRKVQNHLGSVHAIGMALIGETASGCLVGLNLSSDAVPVIKRIEIDYVKRAVGDMRAEATVTPEQIDMMNNTPKGEVDVKLVITDAEGKQPVEGRMLWAWTPKRRQEQP